MSKSLFFLLLTLCALPSYVYAEEADSLYEVERVVSGQSVSDREAAMRIAFDQVLLRLTGDEAVLWMPRVREARRKAQRLVARFSYWQADIPEIELLFEGDEVLTAKEERLLIRFDQEAIRHLLTEVEVELWPVQRQETVVIFGFYGFEAMGFEEDSGFFEEQRKQWQELLSALSEQYALPMRFAGMASLAEDWEEQEGMPQVEMWDDFLSEEFLEGSGNVSFLPAIDASNNNEDGSDRPSTWINALLAHYGSRSVLLGQLSLDRRGQWQTRWQHYLADSHVQSLPMGEASKIVHRLFFQTMKRLREDYFMHRVILPEAGVLVTVRGIHRPLDLQELEALLNALDAVVTLRVAAIEGDEAIFELKVKGGELQLQKELGLQASLRQIFDLESSELSAVLVYQWR